MKKTILFIFLLIGTFGFSQQNAFIDFGNAANASSGNWNNVIPTIQNETGLSVDLIASNGVATGVTLTITDSFDLINTNGTTTPNAALPFIASATRDSYFGATDAGFNGNVNLTGGFTLTGLDASKYYSFSVFASRVGVSDNRETLYTVAGASTDSEALNVSNNTSNTANILNIQPNADGNITFQAEPGDNNNNSSGFFYLGAVQLIISDEPITNTEPDPELTLTYPNGGHLWEVNKTVRVKWESISVADMLVEFSSDNGATWTSIATAPGALQYYDLLVPDVISTECLVRISGEGLSDTSEAVFETIPNEGVVYKIVVLGSSTAFGTGPSNPDHAWVNKYRDYLEGGDTRYEVVNLALGGYATYEILPTGTSIPAGVSRTVDTQRNITKALSLDPGGIIINMPSNDAASGYPVADQLANYSLISAVAADANVPLWVTTPQPRDFGTNTTKVDIQVQMIAETYNVFSDMAIDFWTGFGQADNNGILPQYDAGDGIHMNDAAHQILYERVIGKDIGSTVKDNIDALGVDDFEQQLVNFYPNPVIDYLHIKFTQNVTQPVTITITDVLGKTVSEETIPVYQNQLQWSRQSLGSGLYLLTISNSNQTSTHRILIN